MDLGPLYRSHKTVFELLRDRGYDQFTIKPMSQEEFEDWAEEFGTIEKVKENMQMIASGKLNPKILIHWLCSSKLNSAECTNLISQLNQMGIHNALVIIEDSVTSHVKNTLRLARRNGDIIEVFTLQEMQYNVSHHYLVPKHIICTKEEKKKVKKTYGTNLPEIKVNDPQMRYLGAKRGQLIKVIRPSTVLIGEKAVSYREVS